MNDRVAKPQEVKISVVLPAYNAERYIEEAIESVLRQTFDDFELIVIDDCSTDGTWGIIEKYAELDKRVVPIHNSENLRLSRTLNKGIRISRGKYVARMDSDDWIYPQRFEKQYEFLERNPEVGICGASMEVCDAKLRVRNRREYKETDAAIRRKIFYYSPFCHPVVMMRKSVLDTIGGYDSAYDYAEDYEMYFRLGRHAKFSNLREVLIKYRVVEKSITVGSTKKMEMTTHRIRRKYAKEYGMTFMQIIYDYLQFISLFVTPSRLRIKIFNMMRNENKKPFSIFKKS